MIALKIVGLAVFFVYAVVVVSSLGDIRENWR